MNLDERVATLYHLCIAILLVLAPPCSTFMYLVSLRNFKNIVFGAQISWHCLHFRGKIECAWVSLVQVLCLLYISLQDGGTNMVTKSFVMPLSTSPF